VTTHPPNAIELRGIGRRYPGVVALDGVDLVLEAGRIHALAGENGAGKSTLIKILGGAERPDAGSMRCFGEPYAPRTPLDASRAGIRVVHQELQMLEAMTVAENLLFDAFPRKAFGLLDRRALRNRAKELLARVGLDGLDPATQVATLGMAHRQLIEIARALSAQSRVMVLDEPTATLTPRETRQLLAIMRQLRDEGVAVVFVSHHLEELFEVCDSVTVLRNGRHIQTVPMAQTSPDELVRQMVGRGVEAGSASGTRHAADGTPALEVRGLRFMGQRGRGGIDLTLHAGEIVGLAGLVGSGRTETVRAIFGADRRVAGEILRDGRPVRIDAPQDALREGICLLTENRKDEGLVLDMPITANVSLANLRSVSSRGLLRRDTETRIARQAGDDLRIRMSGVQQHARQLSGGNQQKVVLAKWLQRAPRVLILDEPTRGVDVGAKAEIHSLLQRMAADGVALLVVSSDLRELMGLCDRMLVLSKGTLAGEVARPDFDEEAILAMAYQEYLRSADTDHVRAA